MNPLFNSVVAVTFGIEGGDKLSLDHDDPGNWTGGHVGEGVLRGTRWGISAAAFPKVDVEHLDEAQANGLAFAHYWLPAKCATMPPRMAMLMFDAAFQHGVRNAVEFLQRALGVSIDGAFGKITAAALAEVAAAEDAMVEVRKLGMRFQNNRSAHMEAQPSWSRDVEDFTRRLHTVWAAGERLREVAT